MLSVDEQLAVAGLADLEEHAVRHQHPGRRRSAGHVVAGVRILWRRRILAMHRVRRGQAGRQAQGNQ